MAGDPQSVYYCQHCNMWHNYCPNNSTYIAAPTVTIQDNTDAKILELLQKILDKLEEIRMEI
jgi:hypothetical protein